MTDQEVKSVMADNVKLGEDGEQTRNALMESIKAKMLIEKVNEHRAPELYCNLVDSFDEMDAGIERFIKEFPKKKAAIAWQHFYKLAMMTM